MRILPRAIEREVMRNPERVRAAIRAQREKEQAVSERISDAELALVRSRVARLVDRGVDASILHPIGYRGVLDLIDELIEWRKAEGKS